jgi:hypothetical protein
MTTTNTVIENFCEAVFQLSNSFPMTPEQRVKAGAGILYAFASKAPNPDQLVIQTACTLITMANGIVGRDESN